MSDDFDLMPPALPKLKAKGVGRDLEPVQKKKQEIYSDIDDRKPSTKVAKSAATKKTNNAVRNIFDNDADQIVSLLEEGESDSALERLNKRLIQSSIKLIAQVEKGIHDTNGRYGVHSYNGLVMTIRELVNDLNAAKDRGAIGHTIAENILRPVFLDLGMDIMQEYAQMTSDLKSVLNERQYEEFRKIEHASKARLAAKVQEHYNKMRDEIIGYLQR